MGWLKAMFGLERDGSGDPAISASILGATAEPTNVNESRMFGDNDAWARGRRAEALSADDAAKASAVFFCISIIARVAGSLPREFRDPANNIVTDTPLIEVFDEAPNRLQTGDQFWSSLLYRAALAGIAFAEPVESAVGGVEIWPLDPLRTSVDWEDRDFTVTYLPERGPLRHFRPVDLFWIAGLSDAGLKPLTPWKMAKGSIDFALALEKQGQEFFANGNRLAGFLKTAAGLTDEQIVRLKAGINAWRNGGTPVLEEGMDYKETVSNNTDAQLTELIKQRVLELARYWGIPRSLIGEDSAGKTSSEQEALDFVKYCIRPWARLVEQAVRQRLMTPDQRKKMRFKLNMDGLLRGDSATQFRNAVLARTASTHSVNTIRGWFGEPRIEEAWADDPRTPLNSNRAADTMTGGETAPQDQQMTEISAVREKLALAGIHQLVIDEMFPVHKEELADA